MSASKSDARLRAWIQRVPPTATKLVVAWKNVDQLSVVAEWSRDEVGSTDAAGLAIDAAQDHCDATEFAQRYVIAWSGDDNQPLSTRPIKMEPSDSDDEPSPDAPFGPVKVDASANGVITALLRAMENKDRMVFAAMGGIIKAHRDLNGAYAQEISALRQRVRVAERAAAPATAENDAAEDSEMLERVMERGFKLLEVFAQNQNPNGQPPAGSNGSGHA